MDTHHQFDIGVFAPCGKNVDDIACKTSQKIHNLEISLRLFNVQNSMSAYLGTLQGSLKSTYTSPLVHENLAKNKHTTSVESLRKRRESWIKVNENAKPTTK